MRTARDTLTSLDCRACTELTVTERAPSQVSSVPRNRREGFVLRAQTLKDLPYDVDRLVLRLTVGARLELRKEPKGHELETRKNHQDP